MGRGGREVIFSPKLGAKITILKYLRIFESLDLVHAMPAIQQRTHHKELKLKGLPAIQHTTHQKETQMTEK